jgi:hypothetical protein
MTQSTQKNSSDDLTKRVCWECGGEMGQIIGFDKNAEGDMVPQRRGWYCVQCKTWEKAVLRERTVLDDHY